MPPELRDLFEFGSFTLDAEDGSLKRAGEAVPLPRLAAGVLIALLEQPGRVISQPALLSRVWGVPYVSGGSLHYQVHIIRQALAPDGTALIENVRGRGFRFTGAVRRVSRQNGLIAESVSADAAMPTVGAAATEPRPQRRSKRIVPIAAAAVLATVGIASIAAMRATANPSLRVVESKALTHDGPPGLGSPVFSDGTRLYFARIQDARHLAIAMAGGESSIVFDSASEFRLSDPGSGSESLAIKSPPYGGEGEVWVIPTGSGIPRKVGTLSGAEAVWSPDHRRIALVTGSRLKLADVDGQNLVDVTVPVEGGANYPRWSPDGTRVRFTVSQPRAGTAPHASLWEVGREGGAARPAFPEWDGQFGTCCGVWTPDGRHFVFEVTQRDIRTDLWMRSEPSGIDVWLRRRPAMTQLTAGPLSLSGPVVGPDSRTIFAVGALKQGELVRWDAAARTFVPFLSGVSGTWVSFSRDGQSLAYVGYPDRKLWRARSDGSERRELVSGEFELDGVGWSPDGRWISFRSRMAGRHMKVFLIPSAGGRPEPVTTEDRDEGIASWSPDSRQIVFGDVPAQFGVPSGTEVLRVYDVQEKTLSSLPQSEGLWTSRWSPDGRYISALTIDREQRLKMFDTATRRWKTTSAIHLNNPNFSRDGKSLFYDTEGSAHVLRRFDIDADIAVDITPLAFLRPVYGWSGLAPDDSPIVLKNLTSPAVYALTLERTR